VDPPKKPPLLRNLKDRKWRRRAALEQAEELRRVLEELGERLDTSG
jgi:hypothetical protein